MKSLQQISPYSAEYVIRLRDEAKLVELLKNEHEYFVRVDLVLHFSPCSP